MSKLTIGVLLAALMIPGVSAADEDVDYSNVDCNSKNVRAALIEAYNKLLEAQGFSVVDTYDQHTIKHGVNLLVCNGTYEFSDGEILRITYKSYKNSLGQFINDFEPDEE